MSQRRSFQQARNVFTKARLLLGRKASRAFAIGMIAGLSLGFVEMAMTAFLQLFLRETKLLAPAVQLPKFLENYQPSIVMLSLILIGIGVFRSICHFLINHGSTVASEDINARLRLMLLHRVLHAKHQDVIPGSYCHTLISSVFPVASAVFAHIATALPNCVMVLALLFAMFKIAPLETMFGLVGIAILGLVVHTINRNISRIARENLVEHTELSKGIERVARNWLLVKILRTEDVELDRMQGNVLRQQAVVTRTNFYIQFSSVLPSSFGIGLISVIILASLAYWQTPGLALVSFLYLFLRFVQIFSGIVTSVAHAYGAKAQFLEAWRFFFAIQGLDVERIVDRARSRAKRGTLSPSVAMAPSLPVSVGSSSEAPRIQVRQLEFKYASQTKAALSIKALDVAEGAQLGIVGPSGSGKSTLLLLILGVLKPTSGELSVDGVSPEVYFQDQRRIGYVGPEPFLLAGSIRLNITYGLTESVSDEDCWTALKEASLMDFVKSLPTQLDYEVREDGAGLSAGQKQRIALARAFLMQPQLLILDEATANLDVGIETEIVTAVSRLKGRVTTIIVSHRDAALSYADQRIDLRLSF